MSRFQLACMLSVGLHALAFAGGDLFVFHGARLELSRGETRVAVLFTAHPAPKKSLTPLANLGLIAGVEHKKDPWKEAAEVSAEIPLHEGITQERQPQYLHNVPPAYPKEAFLKNVQGIVWILAVIDPHGRPGRVEVERSSGSEILDTAAAHAVEKWQFLPARRAGLPVGSDVRIPIRFQIVVGRSASSILTEDVSSLGKEKRS